MSDCLGASVPSVIKEYIAVLAKGVPSAARPPVQRDFCLSDNKSVNRTSFREVEVYHRIMEGKKQMVDVDGSPAITRTVPKQR